MGVFEQFPYTNFHELNLDWVLRTLKEYGTVIEGLDAKIKEIVEQELDDLNLIELILSALTTYGLVINVKAPPANLTPASGDGTADDTIAIQGCIDYANSNGGKTVFFPSGAYLTQSLTLKDNVSLVGFDRSTTKIVLKGGATQPLLKGTSHNNTISKLKIDGNMSIQVNDINVIDLTGGKYTFSELEVTDGYTLMNLTTDNNVNGDNIIFGKGVIDSLVVSGTGGAQFNNIVFNELSELSGRYIIDNSVNYAVYTSIKSTCEVDTAIKNTANRAVFVGQIQGASTPILNTGTEVYYNFYALGGSLQEALYVEVNNRIVADNALQVNIDEEEAYRTNADINLQANIDSEATDRASAVNAEATARTNADNALQVNIDEEEAYRTNADINLTNLINSALLNNAISPDDYTGNDLEKITSAINAAVSQNRAVKFSKWYDITGLGSIHITKPLIDRKLTYLIGDGGGIIKNDSGYVWTSDIRNTGDIVENQMKYRGVLATGCKVWDCNNIIRLTSAFCSYNDLYTPYEADTNFLQSIRMVGCNVIGCQYWASFKAAYDVTFKDNLVEWGVNGLYNSAANGEPDNNTLRILDNCIEGMAGYAMDLSISWGVTIKGNYMEANNGGNIILTRGISYHNGLTIQGNTINLTAQQITDNDAGIKINRIGTKGIESSGNACTGILYNILDNGSTGGKIVAISDISLRPNVGNLAIITPLGMAVPTVTGSLQVTKYGAFTKYYNILQTGNLTAGTSSIGEVSVFSINMGVEVTNDDIVSIHIVEGGTPNTCIVSNWIPTLTGIDVAIKNWGGIQYVIIWACVLKLI